MPYLFLLLKLHFVRCAKIFSKFHLSNLNKDHIAAANLEANIVSTLQAGCFVGSLAAWWVADTFGRRKAMMMAAFLAFVGTVMQAASSGILTVMYIGR